MVASEAHAHEHAKPSSTPPVTRYSPTQTSASASVRDNDQACGLSKDRMILDQAWCMQRLHHVDCHKWKRKMDDSLQYTSNTKKTLLHPQKYTSNQCYQSLNLSSFCTTPTPVAHGKFLGKYFFTTPINIQIYHISQRAGPALALHPSIPAIKFSLQCFLG
jgi:hypothetical protein